MDVQQRSSNTTNVTEKRREKITDDDTVVLTKANDGIPLLMYLTNAVFFTLFFSVVYYLLVRWREKIRLSDPLHVVSVLEISAIVSFVASFIYLLGFFGIGIIQPFVAPQVPEEEEDEEAEPTIDIDVMAKNCKTSVPHELLHKSMHVEKAVIYKNSEVTDSDKVMKEKTDLLASSLITKEDEEVITLVVEGKIPSYSLESKLGDSKRAVFIRRNALERVSGKSLHGLPLGEFDYDSILGQCCEMPIGYVQIPVGIAGPLLLDGMEFTIPMATTEGCLVASTNRGCKAIYASGGATSILLKDSMTRAPVVRFTTAKRASELKFFLEDPLNFYILSSEFNKSSRFGRLQTIRCAIAGKNLYIRFTCSTGDAMGMNMVSKGVQNILDYLQTDFPDMDVIGISGNYCSDKKPAAVNWIEGRGKSVVCEAIIHEEILQKVLKTNASSLAELNMLKNLTGSAMAGTLGGFNAHASNIVSAVFIATGQDPAQNIESSHCITMMETVNGGKDLHVSVTMPSIEVGTVGGGTQLASQSACLNLLGVKGANKDSPGSNARQLAKVVAGAVLAGELSLMSAISAGQLVKSHMKYNRSNKDATSKP